MRKNTILLLLLLLTPLAARAQQPLPTPPPVKTDQPPETAAALEARLKQNPKDLEARQKIIKLYERDENDPQAQKALQSHRVAFVQNHPTEWNFGVLGFWDAEEKDKPEFVELRAEWLKQIAADKSNSAIRLKAVEFLKGSDAETAEKILLEGQQLDPENREWYDEIIGIYETRREELNNAYDRGEPGASDAEYNRISAQLLAQGEKQLAVFDQDEYTKTGGAKMERLMQMGKIALEIGDLKTARILAEKLANDYSVSDLEAADENAVYYANNLLGRVALREGNAARAKEHLQKSLLFSADAEVEIYRAPEMDLAAELLSAGERQAPLEYVRKLMKYTKDEDVLKNLRRWERMLKRGLMPFGFEN